MDNLTAVSETLAASVEEIISLAAFQYETAAQLQSFLNQKQYEGYRLQGNIRQYEEEREKIKQDFEEKKKEIQTIDEHIPVLLSTLPNLNSPKLIKEYETMIQDGRTEKAKLQTWMQNNHPNQQNSEFIKYNIHKVNLEYLIAIGTRLGEWFAEGNAGPGTVTFMDKEYKAS